MLIFGYYPSERAEPAGPCRCPRCKRETAFLAYRRFRRSHLYFVPLPFTLRELPAETAECGACGAQYPIVILAAAAGRVGTPLEAGLAVCDGVVDQFGNIVELTDAAASEIIRRLDAGKYDDEVVVRIRPDASHASEFQVQFDYAMADGQDWIGRSHGLTIVVERREAAQLHGRKIDYRDGRFRDA